MNQLPATPGPPRDARPSLVDRFFPPGLNAYGGSPWVVRAMALAAALLTIRSLVHMFAPDGGAQSIASIDISVEGGATIVGLFAQWGAVQLLLAGIVWLVVLRLRALVPLMALVLFLEPLLRGAMGALRPVETVGTAPGAALNYILLLPLGLLLVLSVTTIRGSGTNPT